MPTVLTAKVEGAVTVFKPQDVLDIIDRHCGWDIAKYMRDLFDEYEDADHEAELRMNSDLNSYEASLESNATAFQDILSEIEGLEQELDRARLNREKLHKRLAAVRKILNNQI